MKTKSRNPRAGSWSCLVADGPGEGAAKVAHRGEEAIGEALVALKLLPTTVYWHPRNNDAILAAYCHLAYWFHNRHILVLGTNISVSYWYMFTFHIGFILVLYWYHRVRNLNLGPLGGLAWGKLGHSLKVGP